LRRYPICVDTVRERRLSRAEALAAKRRAHIVIDECVTLACSCVVVNGADSLDIVGVALGRCAQAATDLPSRRQFAT
jgi:hypothetical protein